MELSFLTVMPAWNAAVSGMASSTQEVSVLSMSLQLGLELVTK